MNSITARRRQPSALRRVNVLLKVRAHGFNEQSIRKPRDDCLCAGDPYPILESKISQQSDNNKDFYTAFGRLNVIKRPRKSLISFLDLYFHGGNTGSNPVGDAKPLNEVQNPSSEWGGMTKNRSYCLIGSVPSLRILR